MNGLQVCVKPVEATLTHSTEFLGKMSPYVKIYLGGQYNRSSTCRHGGKNPHWNDTFYMTVPFNSDPNIRVEVWDDDSMTSDDNVGMGVYNLAQYLSQQMNTTIPIDLQFKGKHAGRVTIALQFNNQMGAMPMGGNPMNQNMGGNPMNQGGWNQGW